MIRPAQTPHSHAAPKAMYQTNKPGGHMKPQAQAILQVFRARGLHAGDTIDFPGLGEAIMWEAGFAQNEVVSEALTDLVAEGYVSEMHYGLCLTESGEAWIAAQSSLKHGARVYALGDVVLIKQTVLRGIPPEYVIDEHREQHVPFDDDAAIGAAIRAALSGSM